MDRYWQVPNGLYSVRTLYAVCARSYRRTPGSPCTLSRRALFVYSAGTPRIYEPADFSYPAKKYTSRL